jgi:hypothetical protein
MLKIWWAVIKVESQVLFKRLLRKASIDVATGKESETNRHTCRIYRPTQDNTWQNNFGVDMIPIQSYNVWVYDINLYIKKTFI